MYKSGSIVGRINRRHPWLKMVVLLIIVEILAVILIVEPMLKNGNLRLEIPLGEKTQEVDKKGTNVNSPTENEI